jgi:hypothetical protein
LRLGLLSPLPGYVTHAPYPFLNGLGDVATDQQIAGVATTMATTTVGLLAAFHVAIMGTAMAGPVGAAIAGAAVALGALAQVLIKEFSGCGQSCIVASNDANKYEPYLQQNLQAYLSSPIHYASLQQAALNNFDTIWTALRTACSDPNLGQAGQRCISDRQPGACQWKASPGGWAQDSTGNWKYTAAGSSGSGDQCWNWFVGYRDPIANDPTVVPDPVPGSQSSSAATINTAPGGLFNTSTGAIGGTIAGIPASLLIAGGGLLLFMLMGDKK